MAAVNHQKQYSNDVCNHECRKLCVYMYFNPKFLDSDVLHVGLPGLCPLSSVPKKHSFSKIEIFHSQVKGWGSTYSTGWKNKWCGWKGGEGNIENGSLYLAEMRRCLRTLLPQDENILSPHPPLYSGQCSETRNIYIYFNLIVENVSSFNSNHMWHPVEQLTAIVHETLSCKISICKSNISQHYESQTRE
jgi:hypothetical protein